MKKQKLILTEGDRSHLLGLVSAGVVPYQRSSISWRELYELAEKGVNPETGWHEVYDAQLDAEREKWGPA